MLRSQLLRTALRAERSFPIAASFGARKSFHASSRFLQDEKKPLAANIPSDIAEGALARTDPTVEVEYPEEGDLPSSKPVQGRGGLHFKRTLASFSLEGRVSIVTGGARGLGLVMSQALVISGSDVAIVDLNKEEAEKQALSLIETFKKENPGTEK